MEAAFAELAADLAPVYHRPGRIAAAGFPADHAFATKPALALAQAKRALAAGITPAGAPATRCTGAGFTLSIAKQVLSGKMDDVIETIEHNIRLV
jgi:hypothetical protein